jgi:hypothetical protein
VGISFPLPLVVGGAGNRYVPIIRTWLIDKLFGNRIVGNCVATSALDKRWVTNIILAMWWRAA